jgi:NarL family two-component system sensor histidine kinase LiaS
MSRERFYRRDGDAIERGHARVFRCGFFGARDALDLDRETCAMAQPGPPEHEQLRMELHDMVLNSLATISLSIEVVRNHLGKEQTTVRQELQSIHYLVRETSDYLRGILRVIDQRTSTWTELCGELCTWSKQLLEPQAIAYNLVIAPSVHQLPPPSLSFRVGLYHICREILLNIVKHARANTVQGSLKEGDNRLICEFRDNGIGFDAAQTQTGHYGLLNMQKRAGSLGGTLDIITVPDSGTCITFQLPVQ